MTSSLSSSSRALRLWLIVVAGLISAMVLVGGATRLTESGLSIVEWKPLTGTIPPLSDSAWQAQFEKYQTIPQYQQVNRGMTVDEFKLIYWWEWAHRLLGRLIGAAFLLPFLWFLWRGTVEPALRGWLWAIFGLGALQGAVGWWMVASGLAERVNVSPYRLAFHLTLACAIFALIVWTIQRLRPPTLANAPMRLRATATVLLTLVLCQIYWGALVAGLRAGLLYNTWPLIDGHVVPAAASLLFNEPWWRNLFENPLTVQFTHRMIAYALWVAALVHAIDSVRASRAGLSIVLAIAVTIQAGLGVATLLYQVPILLALAHQGMAIIVLAIAVAHAERLLQRRNVVAAGAPLARAT
jgi:cytochrome c oxidase assembly protein subunit 15